jgi:DNA-binding beta-propeller fold protein YncE
MEFSHDGKKLYTGSIGNILLPEGVQGRYELTVSDPQSLSVLQSFTFDAGIRPFVITHDDKLMYTQLSWLHGLVEVDLGTGKTLRRIELPISEDAKQLPRADYPNDAAHHGLAMSHDGEVLCAAGTLSDYVALIARGSFELIKTIPVGDEPGWAVTSLDGQYCFVGARGARSVSVISFAEQQEITRIPVGGLPQHLLTAQIPERVLASARFR